MKNFKLLFASLLFTGFSYSLLAQSNTYVSAILNYNIVFETGTSSINPAMTILNNGDVQITNLLSIGAGSGAIQIGSSGDGSTITSPSGTVGFGNNNIAIGGTVQTSSLNVMGNSVTLPGIVTDTNTDVMVIDPHGNVKPVAVHSFINQNTNMLAGYGGPCSTIGTDNDSWTVTTSTNTPNVVWTEPCTWVGIGTSSPNAPLTISNYNSSTQLSIVKPSTTTNVFTVDMYGNTNISGNTYAAGNVVIGSSVLSTPGNYGLYVGNGILTSVVKIALTTDAVNWSDYVFGNNYKLKPLTEVAEYIKDNKHLPDVPSASDVKKDGINVAEMDATLLKKIEELTLYMIQQQKLLEEQQKLSDKQQKQAIEQQKLSEQQQKEIEDLKVQLANTKKAQK